MPIIITPCTRDERAYVPECGDLDPGFRSMNLRMKVVRSGTVHHHDYGGMNHSTKERMLLVFSRPVSYQEAQDAAYDTFAAGCSHEHDCCGCWHGGPLMVWPTNRRGSRNRCIQDVTRDYSRPFRRTARRAQDYKPSRHWLVLLGYARNY